MSSHPIDNYSQYLVKNLTNAFPENINIDIPSLLKSIENHEIGIIALCEIILQYSTDSECLESARMIIMIMSRLSNLNAWLLAIRHYKTGSGGFSQDLERSEYYRARMHLKLLTAANISYETNELKLKAIDNYNRWLETDESKPAVKGQFILRNDQKIVLPDGSILSDLSMNEMKELSLF